MLGVLFVMAGAIVAVLLNAWWPLLAVGIPLGAAMFVGAWSKSA